MTPGYTPCVRRLYVALALNCAVSTLGCTLLRDPPEHSGKRLELAQSSPARANQASTTEGRSSEPVLARNSTGTHFNVLASKEPKVRLRCPDELLPRGEAQSELKVELVDVRREARELIPVDLRESVATSQLPSRAGMRTALPDDATSREPSASAEKSRYFAQLRVDDYAGPKLFRRLNAPRSEWAPGKLDAWLVVYDRESGESLCRAPVNVRGDASNAKVSRRLRESTRAELERRLYQRVNSATEQALAGISSVLRRKT